jgi:uncharacterized protein (TIGR03492 family)
VIAVRILQELQKHPNAPELAALPLVGEGRAYSQLGIPIIGTVQTMPSGVFIYMEGRQLMRDLRVVYCNSLGHSLKLSVVGVKEAVSSWRWEILFPCCLRS